MKYLGLDVGQKTVGVATGELIAAELTTLRTHKDESFYEEPARSRSAEALAQILIDEQASAVVIGLPVKEDGSPSQESQRIQEYGQFLQEKLNRSVHYVDETLTSFMARDMLEEQGVSPKEIEARIDQLSAQLILQQYLEEHALA